MSLQPMHLVLASFGDLPLGRMFEAMQWRTARLHLFLHPIRVGRICGERRRLLAGHRLLSALAGAFHYTKAAQATSLALATYRAALQPRSEAVEVTHFGQWADSLWEAALTKYKILTRRDAATLNRLYRPGDRRLRRLRILREGKDIGWLLLALRTLQHHPQLGSLRTCVLVDALSQPEDAVEVMRVGLKAAAAAGADVCMGWWSHSAWRRAARRAGFFGVRSGLTLYVPPKAKPPLLSAELPIESAHFTRGDCDGPGIFIENQLDEQLPFGKAPSLTAAQFSALNAGSGS
jgi:hypothetical protein